MKTKAKTRTPSFAAPIAEPWRQQTYRDYFNRNLSFFFHQSTTVLKIYLDFEVWGFE
jgi:hypothetical protein